MSAGGLQSWGIRTYLIIDTKSTEFMGHQESNFSEFAEISFYWETQFQQGEDRSCWLTAHLLKKPTDLTEEKD